MVVRKKANLEKFISKGADVSSDRNKKKFTNILIRIPSHILAKVDEELKERSWISRTQWVLEAIVAKLHK